MIYDYAVCLLAVITVIICVTGLVNSFMDLSAPLHAERDFTKSPSLVSFENYKMELLTSSEKELAVVPDEKTLKTIYESAKTDKIEGINHRAFRYIMVNGLLIIICVVLFIFHWRWIQRLSKVTA